jgi:phage terminase large subunit-like protein
VRSVLITRSRWPPRRSVTLIYLFAEVPPRDIHFSPTDRTDNGSRTTLLLVHESNGSWTLHGLGAPGVTMSEADTVALAESILARAR